MQSAFIRSVRRDRLQVWKMRQKQGIDIYSVDLSMESKWLTGYCEANQYNIGQMVGKECRVYPGKFSGQEAKNCNHPVQCTASGYQ